MAIIRSIIESDLYSFTQQRVILEKYPDAEVEYVFSDRRPQGRYNRRILNMIQDEVNAMAELQLQPDEQSFMRHRLSFLGEPYLDHLRNYRFDPSEVSMQLSDANELILRVRGLWRRTILWEIPLLAIISECFFKHYDEDWKLDFNFQKQQLDRKMEVMKNCLLAEFGMRRRRCYEIQDFIVGQLKGYKNFVGTSNVHLAHKHDVAPKGTMSHQLTMALSALEGLRYANKHMLKVWSDVYRGDLGIALTDTYGLDAFLGDFNSYYAKLFDGVRHDSNDPYWFTDKVVNHYKSLRINPLSKTIIYSDGLNEHIAADIEQYARNKIGNSYGIGTHLTNDFPNSPALNIVIKLWRVNGIPVVKLSDTPEKAIGEPDAIRVANYIHFNKPLDEF